MSLNSDFEAPTNFPDMLKPTQNTGFTLVELIVVILLIGILAVTALPKMGLVQNDSHTLEYRDRLINVLRHTQLQAMQNTNIILPDCHRVLIEQTRFGQNNNCGNNTLPNTFENDFLGISSAEASEGNLTISATNQANDPVFDIRFNALGQPQQDCNGGCSIQISGTLTATITIESQGYIHR
ncbi:type II secretion system protein [Catenovulum agarivorans]|uniref:type II secretion system protein n=1 Tax=Catenovulum agarivorans TaxID=1172192 RepID=UPI00031EAD7E|nr:type II secretion system protein [Catenovulum agarivorans]